MIITDVQLYYLSLIEQNPGINGRTLARLIGKKHNYALSAIYRLVEKNLVIRKASGNRDILLYVNKSQVYEEQYGKETNSDVKERILDYIKAFGNITTAALSRYIFGDKTNVSIQRIRRNCLNLIAQDKIKSEFHGVKYGYNYRLIPPKKVELQNVVRKKVMEI